MDTRIYTITHKEFEKPDDELYRSLHAGRALGEDLGYEGDNTGDNISEKNRNYCELTGLYWMWKNVSCDIIGLCHYRRYFVRNEDFLKKDYIEEVLESYDIILPNSAETEHGSNRQHYKNAHIWSDMEVCKEVLSEFYPEYVPAFEHFMDTNLANFANMIITKKEILDEYCQFLFKVLFEIEKRVDISDYDDYQIRIFGFISERLLRVWIFMQSYRVKEEEVRTLDPKDAKNQQKILQLRQQLVGVIEKNLTNRYMKGDYYDIVDNSPLDVDFQGKVPVWVCWWQGLDCAPDIVKMCIKSIEENIPNDLAKMHVITLENIGKYVALPTWIIEKFESGAITYTHLSDILRVGLLYRYGGFWMDATYYLARPLSRSIFEKEDYLTLKFENPIWKTDITRGRWSGNFHRAGSGNLLFKYMLNAFYEYWDIRDDMVDYFLIDHIINLAYESFPEVKEMIDNCPCTNPKAHEMAKVINEVYSEEQYNELTSDTGVFKLSYKHPLYEKTLLGRETLYGHLLKTYGV